MGPMYDEARWVHAELPAHCCSGSNLGNLILAVPTEAVVKPLRHQGVLRSIREALLCQATEMTNADATPALN